MSFLMTVGATTVLVPMGTEEPVEGEEEEEHHYSVDEDGYITTESSLLPETAELIYGGIASVIVIAALVKFAGPAVKKAMAARTETIQGELDASVTAKSDADAEAGRIRQALGDIQGERQRLLAEADAQAEAVLGDGRARLEAEVAEMEAKADADIATAAGRSSDELRTEIARRAATAADRVVADTLDAAAQQRLIDDFIQKVGAGR